MKTAIEMTREYARQIYFPEVGEFEIEEVIDDNNVIFLSITISNKRVAEIRQELYDVYRKFQQVVNNMPGKAADMLCPEEKKQ